MKRKRNKVREDFLGPTSENTPDVMLLLVQWLHNRCVSKPLNEHDIERLKLFLGQLLGKPPEQEALIERLRLEAQLLTDHEIYSLEAGLAFMRGLFIDEGTRRGFMPVQWFTRGTPNMGPDEGNLQHILTKLLASYAEKKFKVQTYEDAGIATPSPKGLIVEVEGCMFQLTIVKA
jgi:hypothetical protein